SLLRILYQKRERTFLFFLKIKYFFQEDPHLHLRLEVEVLSKGMIEKAWKAEVFFKQLIY
ncbi:hypothetical protein COE82_20820, partial [Bacillus wiedmannii]